MDKAQFWVLLGNIALAPHMSNGWAIGFAIGCCLLAAAHLYSQARDELKEPTP